MLGKQGGAGLGDWPRMGMLWNTRRGAPCTMDARRVDSDWRSSWWTRKKPWSSCVMPNSFVVCRKNFELQTSPAAAVMVPLSGDAWSMEGRCTRATCGDGAFDQEACMAVGVARAGELAWHAHDNGTFDQEACMAVGVALAGELTCHAHLDTVEAGND
jgi:hypothetical protein